MAEYEARINLDSGKTNNKKSKKDDSFKGGLTGGLVGGLLGSIKSILKPLEAISAILSVALFPLLKPFLILFLKVGILLHNYIKGLMGKKGGAIDSITGKAGISEEEINKIRETGKKLGLSNEEVDKNITKANELEKKKNQFMGIFGTILGSIGGIILGAFFGIPGLIIGAVVGGFIGLVAIIFGRDVASNMLTEMKENISKNWELLKTFGIYVWDTAVENISSNWTLLKTLGTWIWDTITETLSKSWEALTSIGTSIGESLTGILATSFEVLSGIGDWIKDKITGFWDGVKSVGSWVAEKTSMEDGIITPNGDVIRTSPSDYIIATKDPSSLMGGGTKVEVVINCLGTTQETAYEIGQILQRQTNYGGGW